MKTLSIAAGGRSWRRLLAGVVLALLAAQTRAVTEPPKAPILRIEAGMHTAPITRISTDAAGRLALTVSNDKTARLWEVESGRLARVLRLPLDQGSDGTLFSGALSPDGNFAAVGGLTGFAWDKSACIYVFETASGRMAQRFKGLPEVAFSLAFSPDGALLAAGFGVGGIQILDPATGKAVARDPAYQASCYSVDWRKNNGLVTTCYDGKVRLYGWQANKPPPPKLSPNKSVSLAAGRHPYHARFSPDGEEIAVGLSDSPKIALLRSTDLSLLKAPDTTGITNGLAAVAWSADGQTLAASGSWMGPSTLCCARLWRQAGMARIGISRLPAAGFWICGPYRVVRRCSMGRPILPGA